MRARDVVVLAALLCAAMVGLNCGDDPPAGSGGNGGMATPTGSGPGPGSGSGSGASTSSTGGGGGGFVMPDESTSCADAVALEQKDNTLGGIFFDYEAMIGEPMDVDYFTFTATAGDWVRVTTDTEAT